MATQPLTLPEIELLARESLGRRWCDLSRPDDRESAVRCWVRAFLARWSTMRHLCDLQSMVLDAQALADRKPLSAAEEVFLRWLGDETDRHKKAVDADDWILEKLEREAGTDFIREAIEAAERLFPGRRIQVDGGSPMPGGRLICSEGGPR